MFLTQDISNVQQNFLNGSYTVATLDYKPTRRRGVCPATLEPDPPVLGVPGTTIRDADPVDIVLTSASSAAFFAVLIQTV